MTKPWIALTFLVLSSFGFIQSANSATYDEWVAEAGRIINRFETSKLNQVTDDFDCQGMSFGVQQKPITNGGLTQLVLQLVPGDPERSFSMARKIAERNMPEWQGAFKVVLNLLQQGHRAQARIASLKLQHVVASSQCSGGKQGKGFKSSAEQELQSWLSSDAVTRAQLVLKNRDAVRALKVAYCWNKEYAEEKPLSFSQFVFHLDFLTNAGGLGIYNGEYYKITNLLRDHRQYNFSKDARISRKTENIARWMETRWADPISVKHEEDARKNAEILRNGTVNLDYDKLQLLYIRMMRAQVGSTPAQMSFFNRGFVLATGVGWSQTSKRDFRDLFKEMGQLDNSVVSSIRCN